MTVGVNSPVGLENPIVRSFEDSSSALPAESAISELYSLYGLTIRSSVPLPCPSSRGGRVDVALIESSESSGLSEVAAGVCARHEDDGFWESRHFEDGSVRVVCRNHFEFAVSVNGDLVLWRRRSDVADEVLFTYLLGQVFSYCLLAKGIESLHATCVVADGRAVALLGNCGYGKSTLAAAFIGRGCRVLTDDVLVVAFDGDRVLALPSLARLKLLPQSADAFFGQRRAIPMNSITDKMIFALNRDQHVDHPVPLTSLYFLSEPAPEEGISIMPLTGVDPFLSILKGAFNDSVVTTSRLRQQFAYAKRLIARVPARRLSYPRRFDIVPSVCDAILTEMRGDDLER